MTAYRFLEPLDVLFLRGNRLFGDPGSYGESLVPPWPSVAAGAVRSQMLAAEGLEPGAFAAGDIEHPQLGTPDRPGSFAVSSFTLARRTGEGVETLHEFPADLVATRSGEALRLDRMTPTTLNAAIASSAPLDRLPVLATDSRAKPETGLWLTQAGWQQYLHGENPATNTLVKSSSLWKFDPRVGVGLDPVMRRAEDGKLFTVQAVAFKPEHGFLVAIDGADPPASGTLRLGGDGRGTAMEAVDHHPPVPDYEAIARGGRCRIVLTSPGIFPGGWRLPGVDTADRFALKGVSGRLVCAAAPRSGVVSGWDLARKRPKPAQRVAPAGSVYWIDELRATPDALRRLAETGLWSGEEYDARRRAEGFNRFCFAAY